MYPNLAAVLVVSGINQLWGTDITYIRLLEEFVYLAVVLDAFSRRVIGWPLDTTRWKPGWRWRRWRWRSRGGGPQDLNQLGK